MTTRCRWNMSGRETPMFAFAVPSNCKSCTLHLQFMHLALQLQFMHLVCVCSSSAHSEIPPRLHLLCLRNCNSCTLHLQLMHLTLQLHFMHLVCIFCSSAHSDTRALTFHSSLHVHWLLFAKWSHVSDCYSFIEQWCLNSICHHICFSLPSPHNPVTCIDDNVILHYTFTAGCRNF